MMSEQGTLAEVDVQVFSLQELTQFDDTIENVIGGSDERGVVHNSEQANSVWVKACSRCVDSSH